MNNYEYIIASLPDIFPEGHNPAGLSEEQVVGEIKEQCSHKDCAVIDTLLGGLSLPQDAAAVREFYLSALSHANPFIRSYFAFDLTARNAKARYINGALGREPMTDVLEIAPDWEDDERMPQILAALSGSDLLEREKALDRLYWEVAEEAVLMDVFSLEIILSFIARLHTVCRWLSLDPQTGREMFHRLVDEVRGTYKSVQFNANK